MRKRSLKVVIAAAAIVTVLPVADIHVHAENLQSHAAFLNNQAIGSAKVKVEGLRIRSDASQSASQTGTAEYGKSYTVYDTKSAEGYTWYQIGDNQWIADNGGNWLDYNTVTAASSDTKIGSVNVKVNGLRIRTQASVTSDATGYVQSDNSYDVYEKTTAGGYTWYRIGDNQWIADENGGWTDFTDGSTQTSGTAGTVTQDAGTKIGSVNIKVDGLRIRSGASTDSSIVGSVEYGKSYDVYETAQANGFTWYRIGVNQWIADQNTNWVDYGGQGQQTAAPAAASTPAPAATAVPSVMPAAQQSGVNYIGTARVVVSGLSVRSDATTSANKVGTAVNGQTYNVIATRSNGGYTWYQIGNNQWIADTCGRWVVYNGKGESTASIAQQTAVSKSANNPYYGGWSNCTWGAWQLVYNNHGVALPSMGNAGNWLNAARSLGYATGSVPKVGSVAVYSMHVAYVIGYEPWRPNPVEIEEGGFNGGHNVRWVSANTSGSQPLQGYIYFD